MRNYKVESLSKEKGDKLISGLRVSLKRDCGNEKGPACGRKG